MENKKVGAKDESSPAWWPREEPQPHKEELAFPDFDEARKNILNFREWTLGESQFGVLFKGTLLKYIFLKRRHGPAEEAGEWAERYQQPAGRGPCRRQSPGNGGEGIQKAHKQSTKKESAFGICHIYRASTADHKRISQTSPFYVSSTSLFNSTDPGEVEKEEMAWANMSWRKGDLLHWKRVCNFIIITLNWPRLENLWSFPKISSRGK